MTSANLYIDADRFAKTLKKKKISFMMKKPKALI